MTTRTRGRGADGLVELTRLLSPRDTTILEALARHRFLTTQQIERLAFADHTSPLAGARGCRRVLRRLDDSGLTVRLARRVGGFGAGSATSVWHLAPAGMRALSFLSGDGSATRVREPSARFVAHALAVAEVHVRLIEAARTGRFELTSVQIEQEGWRSYQAVSGRAEQLKPDLAVVTATTEFEDHWFIEVDLGTEHLPTILQKCQQYQTYRRTGTEQGEANIFPVVIWLALRRARAEKLRQAIMTARGLDQALFRTSYLDDVIGLITGGAA